MLKNKNCFNGTHQSNKRFWSSNGELIGESTLFMKVKGKRPYNARLNDNQVIEILALLKDGKTLKEIALLYSSSITAIGQIKKNRTYCHIVRDKI